MQQLAASRKLYFAGKLMGMTEIHLTTSNSRAGEWSGGWEERLKVSHDEKMLIS